MYSFSKEFTFRASRTLAPFPPRFSSYVVELILKSQDLNEFHVLADYNEVDVFENYITEKLDRAHLNTLFEKEPTTETITKNLYDIAWKLWPHLIIIVRVSDDKKIWISYSEG